MLKQNLSQRMLQKLSPQQIQLMKLLQIPTVSLEQRIKEELEANPALDEGEDILDEDREAEEFYINTISGSTEFEGEAETPGESEEAEAFEDNMEFNFEEYLTDYADDDDSSSYKLQGDSYNPEEEEKVVPVAVENTFHEYLEQQLGLVDINDERQILVAKQIIGSIDEDGYLRRALTSIVDDLLFSQNVPTTEEEVLTLLKKIQKFDPPGIGSRDLQECLRLQLQHKIDFDDQSISLEEKDALVIALKIVEHYFEEFTRKHYPKLQRQLNVDDQELKEAVAEILKLNPKPASGYVAAHSNSGRSAQYIVPDFIVVNDDNTLELTLNSRNAPDLRINDQYRDMLKSYKDSSKRGKNTRQEKEAVIFIKQKIDSAKWFIDAIRQRQQTMYKTMFAIMEYQEEFFLTGDQKKLRPMILKDIADMTELDISTVSRVANSKYVQTEFGTKRLKDFFSESLQTSDGDEVSTLEVKKILTDIIGEENKRKPFSDEKLKSILRKKGYNIARRTVAKYREQLNIPVARLRKEL